MTLRHGIAIAACHPNDVRSASARLLQRDASGTFVRGGVDLTRVVIPRTMEEQAARVSA